MKTLKKAAEEYAEHYYPDDMNNVRGIVYCAFLAGAEWQKEQILELLRSKRSKP